MKFELYREAKPRLPEPGCIPDPEPGDWRWRLRANNGKIVAEGGEGYEHAHDMVRTVNKYVATSLRAQIALRNACAAAGLTPTGRVPKKARP